METTQEIDVPDLRKTPGGWLAVAVDSPRIAVTADTEAGALALFRERRAIWRQLIAQAGHDSAAEGDAGDGRLAGRLGTEGRPQLTGAPPYVLG